MSECRFEKAAFVDQVVFEKINLMMVAREKNVEFKIIVE